MANQNTTSNQREANNNGIHVPAGRSLADMPPAEPKPCPTNTPKPRNSKQYLREYVTKDDEKNYLVGFLVKIAAERKKGPWREYLDFYKANQSADINAMKPEVFKYVQNMVADLNDAWFEAQDL